MSSASQIRYLAHPQGERIAYRMREGKSDDCPGLFWLSGFKSDMDGSKATMVDGLAERLSASYVRFDYRGHGVSDGDFLSLTLSHWLEDALLAFDEITTDKQILIGSSMGGWLALLLALRRPDRVAGLVLIAPAPDFTARTWERLTEDEQVQLRSGQALVRPSAYDDEPYVYTPELFASGRELLLLNGPVAVTCPVRIVHGQADPDVDWKLSLTLAERLISQNVDLTFIKDGDHRLSDAHGLSVIEQAIIRLMEETKET